MRRAGVDRAVGLTVLGRAWTATAGVVTLILITQALTPKEQGYYFTYSNLLSLVVFLELGLQFIVLQFASHERAHLEFTDDGALEGDPAAKARLASLLRSMTGWYLAIAAIFALIVAPIGLTFFHRQSHGIPEAEWRLPWLWIVLVSAGSIALTPVTAILEGCGLVADVAGMQARQGVVGSIGLWAALLSDWRLFACPVSNTIYLIYTTSWIALRRGGMLSDLWHYRSSPERISWKHDIWPLQWRTALSCVSGYFIFQLFNPILFLYRSPAEAGRMGLTLTVVGTLVSIGLAWVTTKASPFGVMIARREFEALDRTFFSCLRQSLILMAAGGLALTLLVWAITESHLPIGARILGPLPTLLLAGAAVANHVTFSVAIYLRAHKQEPLVALSLAYAALMIVSSLLLGRWYGATGMMAGYCVIATLNAFGAVRLFERKRLEWHAPLIASG